jgi:hypothetical protein
MSTCGKTFKEPDNQNKSEATDEQISRWHKGESRFASSPQIHKGEQSQYPGFRRPMRAGILGYEVSGSGVLVPQVDIRSIV